MCVFVFDTYEQHPFIVVDGAMTKLEGVMKNVQVDVEKIKFLTDIVAMDMEECLVTLGRSFLTTSRA